MKKLLFSSICFLLFINCFAVPGVTLTSTIIAAGNVQQGSNNNIIYIVQADVSTDPETITGIQFTITGTHDNNDVPFFRVYVNSTPSLTGSTNLANFAGTFAAPHTYNPSIGSVTIPAGSTRYFIIAADIASGGTHNNTIKIDGNANPVTFTYTVAPVLTNNQTDAAGLQIIKAADITYSSVAVAAANLPQGTGNNIIYILKADGSNFNAVASTISFTAGGTHDNNDVPFFRVYVNSTPSLTGATNLVNASGAFAAPHTYNLNIGGVTITAGTTNYFIIAADIAPGGTHNNTIKIDGNANPVTLGFTTSPNTTNSQTDVAGTQTIKAADVTYSSVAVSAANVLQGTSNNIIYILKADGSNFDAITNSISFTAGGTHDNNDVPFFRVYVNSTPSLTGATNLVNISGAFAAPHTYNPAFGNITITAGSTRYFIIAADVAAGGTHNNTIKIDGNANPVTLGYTTSPNITNSQTDVAGTQTIKAADVTYSSVAVSAANVLQGSSNNIIYILKADGSNFDAVTNTISFTAGGTHDNNDVPFFRVYVNSTPSLTGATNLANISGAFAAPHTYNPAFGNITITAGTTRYFIIAADIASGGTHNNTIKIDGNANPVTLGYTTSPNITNSQTDVAGIQTIKGADVTLTTTTVPASNVTQGTNNQIFYIVKAEASFFSAGFNGINFTVSGTHDNNDISFFRVYSNSTPSLTGATNLTNIAAGFAAPHTYNASFGNISLTAGSFIYLILAADVTATATHNNTFKTDGAVNPVSLNFTTSPNITNNQTDAGGLQTIKGPAVTLSTPVVPGGSILAGEVNKIIYITQLDNELFAQNITGASVTVTGTFDNNDITQYSLYANSTASLTGATFLQSKPSGAAAPNALTFTFNQAVTPSSTVYFILTATLDAAATVNNTIKVDGAVNPASFTYSLSPVVTNNQSDNTGTFIINSLLPVTLTGFTALAENGQVHLTWNTTSEINTAYFDVLHSTDGISFSPVVRINASGGSSLSKTYSTWHTNPAKGMNYYRLKMADKDNSFSYSPIVSISNKQDLAVLLYPNPASNSIGIDFVFAGNEEMQLCIYNAAGVLVSRDRQKVHPGSNRWQKNISHITAGQYLVTATDARNNLVFKITFIKTNN